MKKVLFIILIFVSCLTVHAQRDGNGNGHGKEIMKEITDLNTFHILGVDDQTNANVAMLNQIGDNNTIEAIQQNTGVASNQILSFQTQNNNFGRIEQSGEGHQTILIQNGIGNYADLDSEGSDSYNYVLQNGNNNEVKSVVENDNLDTRTAMLIQWGNNNKIDLPVEVKAQGVNVFQLGNGHEADITGSVGNYSPINVTQFGGLGSRGMKIEINSSYFSFPMRGNR